MFKHIHGHFTFADVRTAWQYLGTIPAQYNHYHRIMPNNTKDLYHILPPALDTTYSFTHLHIYLTPECHWDCDFCCEKETRKILKVCEYPDIMYAVNALNNEGLLKTVSLTGGEPSLHPYFKDICKTLHDAGFTVVVNSNGENDKILDRSRYTIKYLNISVPDYKFDNPGDYAYNADRIRITTSKAPPDTDWFEETPLNLEDYFKKFSNVHSFLVTTDMEGGIDTWVTIGAWFKYMFLRKDFQPVEFAVHDYYMYGVFYDYIRNIEVVLSWSDMRQLREWELEEEKEGWEKICRELILTSKGLSRSWNLDIPRIWEPERDGYGEFGGYVQAK